MCKDFDGASRENFHRFEIFPPITRECGGVCYSWPPCRGLVAPIKGQRCTRTHGELRRALKRETVITRPSQVSEFVKVSYVNHTGPSLYKVERKKAAKLRESSAWFRLAGAYQNRAFFLHKPVRNVITFLLRAQACAEKSPVLLNISQAQTGRTFSQLSSFFSLDAVLRWSKKLS